MIPPLDIFITLLFALAVRGEEVPECPSLTPERLSRIKSMTVTEDVHDKLVGDLSDVWGSKVLFEEDSKTCLKYSREKVDDKVLSQFVNAKGKWFGGEQTRNSTLEKVDNGIYLEVLHDFLGLSRFVLAKVYVLWSKDDVFGYFWCLAYSPPAGSKQAGLPSLSGVAVKKEVLKRPLESSVQEAVDQAVSKIQEAQDLLSEITQFNYPC